MQRAQVAVVDAAGVKTVGQLGEGLSPFSRCPRRIPRRLHLNLTVDDLDN